MLPLAPRYVSRLITIELLTGIERGSRWASSVHSERSEVTFSVALTGLSLGVPSSLSPPLPSGWLPPTEIEPGRCGKGRNSRPGPPAIGGPLCGALGSSAEGLRAPPGAQWPPSILQTAALTVAVTHGPSPLLSSARKRTPTISRTARYS